MNDLSKPSYSLETLSMKIPKAELHVHIEGTLEPELFFLISKRNNLEIPYSSIEELHKKYNFSDLCSFLEIYYKNCSALLTKQDFYDLMYEYLKKSSTQGLRYAEIFFDPQTHLNRGVSFETFFSGFSESQKKAESDFGIKSNLIMCFLRDLSEDDAFKVFEMALPHKSNIMAIGLDSEEIGHPPEKFKNLFKIAKQQGFRLCCHAGEEGPVENIRTCLEMGIERIDHGVKIVESEEIMNLCANLKVPLTLCPISNVKLKVYNELGKNYPIKKMMEKRLIVTINSDDPAYFGGYIGENYQESAKNCELSVEDMVVLAKNSFEASFLSSDCKEKYIKEIDNFMSLINH